MKLGTNVPMGPLTLADFIGLDTCLAIMEVLHDGMGGDSKYRPCPLLRKYVEAGWLGRKSGRGLLRLQGAGMSVVDLGDLVERRRRRRDRHHLPAPRRSMP